ncbi:ABC transporter ATP-binding protein [Nodosilinea sp. FACHB-131]|uniref:ABC transporter ATP-binding protein n=1 Tax=Cyanophyceae TaxID=3028117 RepID=UPI001689B84E|nr:ABC transporter ATP-binding protein [Nodosilinea sp. FACHB-131]MBD1876538.1 ABC transporter ATP-binding protein [Nodosilinea sp. FACHB-131]
MSSDIAISVSNLSKCYQIYDKPQDRLFQMLAGQKRQYFREFWALKDISFEVKKGETFGIIGRNGSGKSTLLQVIAGTLDQTSGSVTVNGRIAALLELGSGFNPNFTGRENVFLNGSILGLSKQEIAECYDQVVEFADIGDFIDQPVKTYSSGMFVRLAFAVQAHINANIIIIDEALAVGDVFFRQKCYARLEQLRDSGAAIVLVSHSMPDVEQYCERAILIDKGNQEFIGSSSEAAKEYYLLYQSSRQNRRIKHSIEMPDNHQQLDTHQLLVPRRELFIDLSQKKQISQGEAICTGIVLCDVTNQPCYSFRQGDEAIFYYEFRLLVDIEVPICGAVLKNDRAVIVHGKNSWQFSHDVPKNLSAGSKILCQHRILLNLQPGEYTFEVALASLENFWWQKREHVSHEEISSHFCHLCSLSDVGSFTVGLAAQNGVSVLTHHGIADLPGDMKSSVVLQMPSDNDFTPESLIG